MHKHSARISKMINCVSITEAIRRVKQREVNLVYFKNTYVKPVKVKCVQNTEL